MKITKEIVVSLASLLVLALFTFGVLPLTTFAHGTDNNLGMMMGGEVSSDGQMMMRNMEDQMVGDEVHQEMEELMQKMMTGNMTELEANQMLELMQENQLVGSMMMERMMSGSSMGDNWTDIHHQQMARFHSPGYMIVWWLFGALLFIFLILANLALLKWLKS